MAVDVTQVFMKYQSWCDDHARELFTSRPPLRDFVDVKLVRSVAESKTINNRREPGIIISSSGMCTGGRIKHHLIHNLPRAGSSIVFVGYQAHGTLGRYIVNGANEARIHGRTWPVNARIFQVGGMSAHADRTGLLTWAEHFRECPRHIFLTHGENEASESLAAELRRLRPDCEVSVPHTGDTVDLGGDDE